MKTLLTDFLLVGLVVFAAATYAEAVEAIKIAAEQGNAKAQAKLASMYLLGREGVEVNEKLAAEWM